MSDKKVLSFDEYVSDDDVTLEQVETKRGVVNIGSCSSAEIMEWFEENDAVLADGVTPDREKRKFKGLRLIARSIVNPDGSRIPKDMRPSAIAALRNHDQRENGRLMKAAFQVNGLLVLPTTEKSPNVSSETESGVSPIDSPSPRGR